MKAFNKGVKGVKAYTYIRYHNEHLTKSDDY